MLHTSNFSFIYLAISLFCASSCTTTAQSIKAYDKIEIQTLYINAKDSMVRFQVLSENKNNKYSPTLTYFWYKSNSILKTTGGADGKLLNGEYACFYADNNLKEKGKFMKGIKDGLWISWFENGKIREQIHWKKGLLHGTALTMDKDGTQVSSKKYKKGALQKVKEKKKKVPAIKKVKEKQDKEVKEKKKTAPVKPQPKLK